MSAAPSVLAPCDVDHDVRCLRSFLIVAEELHFGRAAARLSVSASAITQQINRLERDLGHYLFHRTSRSVRVSEHGRALIPLATEVVAATDRLAAWVAAGAAAEHGLRIGVTPTAPGLLQRPILTQLVGAVNDRVTVRELDHQEEVDALIQGEVDAVYAREPVRTSRLRTVPLFQEARVAVLRRDHALAERPSATMAELAGETFLPMAKGSPQWVDFWLGGRRGSRRMPALGPEVAGFAEMLQRCAEGAGIGIAPACVSALEPHADLRFVRLDDLRPTRVLLCTLERAEDPTLRTLENVSRRVVMTFAGRAGRRREVGGHPSSPALRVVKGGAARTGDVPT
jgi:DNA-binding transcriptional LysR family regulator